MATSNAPTNGRPQFCEVVAEADAAHDVLWRFNGLQILAHVLAYQGDLSAARAAANAAIEAAAELGEVADGGGYLTLAVAALAAGDVAAADDAIAAGWHHISVQPEWRQSLALTWPRPRWRAGACRRPTLGRRRRRGGDRLAPALALATRARVAIAQGEPGQAERDAHEALAIAASAGAYLGAPDGIVKLFGNGCGAVDVTGLGGER